MSRIAKSPVELPKGVEFKQEGNVVTLKGGIILGGFKVLAAINSSTGRKFELNPG